MARAALPVAMTASSPRAGMNATRPLPKKTLVPWRRLELLVPR